MTAVGGKGKGRRVSAEVMAPPSGAAGAGAGGSDVDGGARVLELRLYVAGQTPRSLAAFANLTRLCDEVLEGRYRVEVVDLIENPQLAEGDQIVAVPTVVRRLPEPIKKVIGDLSNRERTLVGLDLRRRS